MILNTKIKPILGIILLAGSLNAHALESDRNQPIAIEADQGSLDQKNQVTTFSGNVIIKQGSLNIRAANVRVSQDKSGNQTMNAEGNPVKFGQQLENKGYVEGQGTRVEYASATGLVKLSGNAKVQRGGDVAVGDVITYNMRTEVYTVLGGNVTGAKKGGRVSVIIQPTTVNKNKK
ncbi:lipopolysaccharide transport periplasmic protein LptA [Alysiella filiformis]|uniref:Lipopolysaccharide export system protein LptA n=1 Tax=Alysiella filiformis DSM 16848 TaxID=1120981 RepID=A0A286E3U8_9NEIS|nr:lipopolysaccharide transport periplasmic protein LptA [Alysiella filiformis]QMT31048.1 lipopolysaccharide transport periplasmic protein LptA [Alysiella filiformis]UBQ55961.1 lipopolysaccharide transport periplasmic protein LptA [Alysiella filiformis DSM 16848]SOD65582.1 lipopolysaccharide export system protein LptA [Alysiella filiformis DSM 16848]